MNASCRAAQIVRGTALLTALMISAVTSAHATGPGGWDHLGTGVSATQPALDGRVDALVSVPRLGALSDSL